MVSVQTIGATCTPCLRARGSVPTPFAACRSTARRASRSLVARFQYDRQGEQVPQESQSSTPRSDDSLITPAGITPGVVPEYNYYDNETTDAAYRFVYRIRNTWAEVPNKPLVALYAGAAVLTLYILNGAVNAVDRVPLLPSFLKLVGAYYTAWFSWKYLLFSEGRQQLARDVEQAQNNLQKKADDYMDSVNQSSENTSNRGSTGSNSSSSNTYPSDLDVLKGASGVSNVDSPVAGTGITGVDSYKPLERLVKADTQDASNVQDGNPPRTGAMESDLVKGWEQKVADNAYGTPLGAGESRQKAGGVTSHPIDAMEGGSVRDLE